MIVQKVISALKDGTFLPRARNRLQYGVHLYYVNDRGAELSLVQRKQSAWLQRKFHKIIEAGVSFSPQDMKKSNKVWICWLQGEKHAPDLVNACIASVRKNMPDKEIVVLQEETLSQYIKLPEYITEQWQHRKIHPADFSDIIRIELLCSYGGIWIDATALCTHELPKYIIDTPLFVYKDIDLRKPENQPIILSNWFISSYSNHPILLLTRDLMWEYRKLKSKKVDYFLFHLCFTIAAARYPEWWQKVPTFNNCSPHVLQFELDQPYTEERWQQILSMSPIHKLTRHIDFSKSKASFYQHILEEFLP